jgi:membrane protease YdiL (CAAX protease family)
MTTITRVNTAAPGPSTLQLALVFAALFTAYQLPEGLGQHVLHSVPVQAVLLVMFFPIAWVCGRALGFRRFDAWFMQLTPGWGTLLAASFGMALLAKGAALGLGAGAGVYRIESLGLQAAGVLMALVITVPYTVFSSVAEDIVTRAFVMRAFPALGRRRLFIAASAGLYVLNHIYRLQAGPLEWAMLFCFGLAYAAALFYSRSLWPAIGLHWGWNFAGQLADRVAHVELVRPAAAPLVSILAHLALLAIVVLVARSKRAASGAIR